MEFENKWNNWLRKASRTKKTVNCTLCKQELPRSDFADYQTHFTKEHAQTLDEKTTLEERTARIKELWEASRSGAEKSVPSLLLLIASFSNRLADTMCRSTAAGPDASHRSGKPVSGSGETNQAPSSRRRPTAAADRDTAKDDSESPRRSPASSLKREGSRSQSPQKRPKAVRPTSTTMPNDSRGEFDRGPQPKGSKLWSPGEDPIRPQSHDKNNVASNHKFRPFSSSQPKAQRQNQTPSQHSQPSSSRASSHVEDDTTEQLIKQPETRPISQEQLVTEVKGIYAGLVMVESKCIEVDNAQNAQNDTNTLNNEQWQALIALHRTLLHEHHDFFLASQHPSASPALRRLASKYAMPARMWRHGIHSFLELLRHRLPASLEHMLTFIYLAYSMMALLYETVPAFEDTWIECLGDLGRYRMAIEDDNIRDRETWTSVSRHWYSKASDKAPTTGRLYHHLAILARPTALQQLYYYTKSLCVAIPFPSARESIMTLFDPVLGSNQNQQSRLAPTELAFVRTHGIMFSKKSPEKLESSMNEFVDGLDNHIARSTKRWLEPGYYIGLSNICAIVGYGNDSNPIYNVIKQVDMGDSQDHFMTGNEMEPAVPKDLEDALKLANSTHGIVLKRFGDLNILPYLHVTLAFIYHLTYYPEAMAYVAPGYPWKLTAVMLNFLMDSVESHSRIESIRFPEHDKGKGGEQLPRPLPEDYAMRGLLWVDRYFPDGWFSNDKIDDDEKYFEVGSMSEERRERVLYLGCRIAARGDGKWLRYDSNSHQFSVNPIYDIELDLGSLKAPGAVTSEPSSTTMPIIDSAELGELPDANATVEA
ncbi:EST/SMG-like protein 1 [Naviculisporaceae sp. PSN 640]